MMKYLEEQLKGLSNKKKELLRSTHKNNEAINCVDKAETIVARMITKLLRGGNNG